jgi:hypothetical protein
MQWKRPPARTAISGSVFVALQCSIHQICVRAISCAGLPSNLPHCQVLSADCLCHHNLAQPFHKDHFSLLCLSSHLFFVLRHFMVVEDHAAPGAASVRHAPFYGDKIGRCILSEELQNRWATMTCQIMGALGHFRCACLLRRGAKRVLYF